MTSWGLCATVKAPADQVLGFVAHHLSLGASELWLHFDDPSDTAFDAVAGLPGVRAVRCDDAHWTRVKGKRPEKHQQRQTINMQAAYAATRLPWLGHIDVDEFLWPHRPIPAVLEAVPAERPMLRIPPWEALHDPAAPEGPHSFRAAMKGPQYDALRRRIFGPYADLLPDGVLSHSVGKCLFRTGVPGLEPRLHGAFRGGARVQGDPLTDAVALLHVHADDPVRWQDRLAFRLTKGAYQYNPPLAAFLAAAGPAEVAAFYAQVQTARPETLRPLRDAGLLLTADLRLTEKIAALKDRP